MSADAATVLVVEDERLVARDLQRTLIRFGYHVPVTVASADEAAAACVEAPPAIVLVDIHLKGETDGISLGQRLRDEFDIPFVYLTAFADEETVFRARGTQPGGYLLKPVNHDELRIAVEVALHRHEAERRVRARERWARRILDAAGDGIIVVDRNGSFEVFNEAARRIVGVGPEGAPSTGWASHFGLYHLDGTTPYETAELPLTRALHGESTDRVDVLIRNAAVPDGVCVSVTGRPLTDDSATIVGAVITLRDVTALRRTQERLATLATTDGLTGLGNHRAFQERLAEASSAGSDGCPVFSLALLDVDGFKELNDRLGHPTGDSVLARIAEIVRANVRRTDFAARYGGDEFCVLYAGTGEEQAAALAERLRSAIAMLSTPMPVTVSIGVCGYRPSFGRDGAALLQATDEALYRAKQAGKNCVARSVVEP